MFFSHRLQRYKLGLNWLCSLALGCSSEFWKKDKGLGRAPAKSWTAMWRILAIYRFSRWIRRAAVEGTRTSPRPVIQKKAVKELWPAKRNSTWTHLMDLKEHDLPHLECTFWLPWTVISQGWGASRTYRLEAQLQWKPMGSCFIGLSVLLLSTQKHRLSGNAPYATGVTEVCLKYSFKVLNARRPTSHFMQRKSLKQDPQLTPQAANSPTHVISEMWL